MANGDYRANPPAGDDSVELADGLSLERLADDEEELVLNACTPRGHFFIPVRQFGQRYSLVLAVDPPCVRNECGIPLGRRQHAVPGDGTVAPRMRQRLLAAVRRSNRRAR